MLENTDVNQADRTVTFDVQHMKLICDVLLVPRMRELQQQLFDMQAPGTDDNSLRDFAMRSLLIRTELIGMQNAMILLCQPPVVNDGSPQRPEDAVVPPGVAVPAGSI